MSLLKTKPRLTIEQTLAAKPVRSSLATTSRADDVGGRVTLPIRGARWAWFLRDAPEAKKTFELDPIGLFVWDQCDGKTSVRRIIQQLAERYNLTLREAEVSTRQFLHTLARKGLIVLAVK